MTSGVVILSEERSDESKDLLFRQPTTGRVAVAHWLLL
jgi:hypothetical protein